MQLLDWIRKLFGVKKKSKREPRLTENEFFAKQARKQFVKLNEKGLSIPIVSL